MYKVVNGKRFTSRRDAPPQVQNVVRRIAEIKGMSGDKNFKKMLGSMPQPRLQWMYWDLFRSMYD